MRGSLLPHEQRSESCGRGGKGRGEDGLAIRSDVALLCLQEALSREQWLWCVTRRLRATKWKRSPAAAAPRVRSIPTGRVVEVGEVREGGALALGLRDAAIDAITARASISDVTDDNAPL